MSIADYLHKDLPDYYPMMYLDGFSPEEILYALHKSMIAEYLTRREQLNEPLDVKLTSEVKIKK